MLPAIVMAPGKADVYEGSPLRTLRLADKLNPCLVRKTVAFPRVARNARAHNVLPCSLTATVSRQDVIEIQFVPLKNRPAILTGIPIALEHIVPGKLDLLLRQPFEKQEHDDPWNTDTHGNRSHHLRLGIGLRKVPPARKIVR